MQAFRRIKRSFFGTLHHQTHFDALMCKMYLKNNERFHFLIFCSGNTNKVLGDQMKIWMHSNSQYLLSSIHPPDSIVENKIRDLKFADFSKQACCFGWGILFANIVFWYDKRLADDTIPTETSFFASKCHTVSLLAAVCFAGFFVNYCFSVWLFVNWKKSVINQVEDVAEISSRNRLPKILKTNIRQIMCN